MGNSERESAETALEEHFTAGRLTPAEHESRLMAAKAAVVKGDLTVLFEDLPEPNPFPKDKVGQPLPPGSGLAGVGFLVFVLGAPTAVVMGFVYGLWWLLAPVVVLSIVFFILADKVERSAAK